jgi:hypothetical protein
MLKNSQRERVNKYQRFIRKGLKMGHIPYKTLQLNKLLGSILLHQMLLNFSFIHNIKQQVNANQGIYIYRMSLLLNDSSEIWSDASPPANALRCWSAPSYDSLESSMLNLETVLFSRFGALLLPVLCFCVKSNERDVPAPKVEVGTFPRFTCETVSPTTSGVCPETESPALTPFSATPRFSVTLGGVLPSDLRYFWC